MNDNNGLSSNIKNYTSNSTHINRIKQAIHKHSTKYSICYKLYSYQTKFAKIKIGHLSTVVFVFIYSTYFSIHSYSTSILSEIELIIVSYKISYNHNHNKMVTLAHNPLTQHCITHIKSLRQS